MDPHPNGAHQPGGGGADPAKAQNGAGFAREAPVANELVELARDQGIVFHQQALGRGEGHGQRVLRHRIRISAAIAGDRDMHG